MVGDEYEMLQDGGSVIVSIYLHWRNNIFYAIHI